MEDGIPNSLEEDGSEDGKLSFDRLRVTGGKVEFRI